MRKTMLFVVAVIGFGILLSTNAMAQNRVGGGLHYWWNNDELKGPAKNDGVGAYVSFQRDFGAWWRGEADAEVFEDGFAGSPDPVLAPQVFLLFGAPVYVGVGGGILFSDSNFADAPFLAFRVGLDFELFEGIHVDINANYQFSQWGGINKSASDKDSDVAVAGVAVRWDL